MSPISKVMGTFPDFSGYGYHITRELGANRSGGRVTYLSVDTRLNCEVVIKQFQFAQSVSSWSAYDAHQREIDILRDLDHPGIPRYLDSFQLADGFCMVQEYKSAQSLAASRSFNSEEIKAIAISVLKILVYLQNRIPPIIHRDLKPDNILVDNQLNVFLVDFGFARIGDGEVGVSSVVKGTLGFMPPEQLFNRQLTDASDLYGLGMTLICLLTNTKADDIGDLVDISYRVKFKHLVPKLSVHWVKWLEKITEPRFSERFTNAQEALQCLPRSPIYPPTIQLSQCDIQLKATALDERLLHPVTITNPISEVCVTGQWEIRPHPNDPVSSCGQHPWIKIEPMMFERNQVTCSIVIDTSKLMAGASYNRTLLLHTNATPQTYSIPLTIHTAPIPIRSAKISPYPLIVLSIVTLLIVHLSFQVVLPNGNLLSERTEAIVLGLSMGMVVGLQGAAWTLRHAGITLGSQLPTVATACVGIPTLISVWLLLDHLSGTWNSLLTSFLPGIFSGWLLGLAQGITAERLSTNQVPKGLAIALVLLTGLFSASLAFEFLVGVDNLAISFIAIASLIGLLSLLLNSPLNHAKRIASYRKLERNRILP